MKRGDLVTIVNQGDFGKPRPALIIQADLFNELTSVTLLPITSTLVAAPLFRINIQPSEQNGLEKISQIMIDKTLTLKRDKIGAIFGHIEPETLIEVERALAIFLGIAK